MPSPSSTAALTLLSLLTLTLSASAQNQASLPDLSTLPECAQKAATKGIASTPCALTDFTCICKSQQFVEGVGASIAEVCSPEDQQKTLAFAQAVCEPLGVTLPTAEIAAPSSAPAAKQDQPSAAAAPDASSAAPAATETYAAPSAAADNDMAATSAPAMMPSVTPPYPIASNGSTANMTNQTALPFEGGASHARQQPLQLAAVAVTALVAGAGFSFL